MHWAAKSGEVEMLELLAGESGGGLAALIFLVYWLTFFFLFAVLRHAAVSPYCRIGARHVFFFKFFFLSTGKRSVGGVG